MSFDSLIFNSYRLRLTHHPPQFNQARPWAMLYFMYVLYETFDQTNAFLLSLWFKCHFWGLPFLETKGVLVAFMESISIIRNSWSFHNVFPIPENIHIFWSLGIFFLFIKPGRRFNFKERFKKLIRVFLAGEEKRDKLCFLLLFSSSHHAQCYHMLELIEDHQQKQSTLGLIFCPMLLLLILVATFLVHVTFLVAKTSAIRTAFVRFQWNLWWLRRHCALEASLHSSSPVQLFDERRRKMFLEFLLTFSRHMIYCPSTY